MLERNTENSKEATLHSDKATDDRKAELYQVFTDKNDKVEDTGKRIDNHIAINDAKNEAKSIDNFSQRVGLKTDLLEDVDTTVRDSPINDVGDGKNDFFTDSDGNI